MPMILRVSEREADGMAKMMSDTSYCATASSMHSRPPTTLTPESSVCFLPGSSSITQTMSFSLCGLRLSSCITIAPAAPAPMSIVRRRTAALLRRYRRAMR